VPARPEFTASLPPGFGDEARQINKAAASVGRNICEGAGRWRPAEKVLKFEIASGEACESAGAVQVVVMTPTATGSSVVCPTGCYES
jgi:four helix bundle protein